MSYPITVLGQMVAIISRHKFEALANRHHIGQKFRKYNRWSQFLAMLTGQLSGRTSLRDIAANLKTRNRYLYHLGMRETSRSTLARVNEQQSPDLYEELFGELLVRCQNAAPKHKFSFKNKLYLLDSTHIEMSLSVFPWATFRQAKGGIKVHVGLDASGSIPAFVDMTTGCFHESRWAKSLNLPQNSFVCFDRGFTDYSWYASLDKKGVFFVTRLKSNAASEPLAKRRGRKSPTIKTDRMIRLKDMKEEFRRVDHRDPETGHLYHFLTNAHHLKASEVADIYKHRWQIELFFKWIKQNLKIKTFLGTSCNAVMTQIWIAMIAYLLIAYFKFKAKLDVSLKTIAQILQMNLFEKRDFRQIIDPKEVQPLDLQILLFR